MTKKIGFIGYGLRSGTMMNAFRNLECDIAVAGIVDPNQEKVKEKMKGDPLFDGTVLLDSTEELLKMELDGIFIGTRCSMHTDLACKVLSTDIPLFLEKPVCINIEQYEKLRNASLGKEDRVVVSFPLRYSSITGEMKRIVDSGILGKLTMVQAINNVPYGSVYYHSWYRDTNETGGLFLQKATHDIDYINYLIDDKPSEVCATKSKLYYKGNKPAGLHCTDCSEYRTCIESSYVVSKLLKEEVTGDACCFAVDTGNEDLASAIFTTESGLIISYNQNFIVKKGAQRRGCRLIGTKGSAEFDFYTAEIRVDHYQAPQTDLSRFNYPPGAHFGGDEELALDFMNVMNGKKAKANLKDGLISAACCLAARQSSEDKQFVKIKY